MSMKPAGQKPEVSRAESGFAVMHGHGEMMTGAGHVSINTAFSPLPDVVLLTGKGTRSAEDSPRMV